MAVQKKGTMILTKFCYLHLLVKFIINIERKNLKFILIITPGEIEDYSIIAYLIVDIVRPILITNLYSDHQQLRCTFSNFEKT